MSIHDEVLALLRRLDGTLPTALSLLTGLSLEEITDLGGVPD